MHKKIFRFRFPQIKFIEMLFVKDRESSRKNFIRHNSIYPLLTILIFLGTGLLASGGMGGGGGPIPQGKDRERFHLGKAIYNLEIENSPIDPAKEVVQAERLEYLQGSLPNSEKRRVSLPGLAGKLSDVQLDALEYFISVRFNVKLEKK